MRRSTFYLLLLLIPTQAFTQRENFFEFGVGISFTSVTDYGQSPLPYKSKSTVIKIGYESFSSEWIHKFTVDFQYGRLKNCFSPDFYKKLPYIVLGHVNYSVNHTRCDFANGIYFSPGLFIGLTTNMRIIPKLGNSMAGYDIFPAFGFSGTTYKAFNHDCRNFRVSHMAQIPVVAYLMRSNYVSMMNYIDPKATYTGTILSSGKVVSLNKLFHINSDLNMSYILKNNNQIRLSHHFSYYRCNTINKSRTQQNRLLFSTMYNL